MFSPAIGTAAYFDAALSGFNTNSSLLATDVAQLASGNRLVEASTDVAALSISTLMQSQIVGVKVAQTNAAQGNALLQVASGGLQTIQNLLSSLNALAVQANSGALTTVQRQQLQQQFSILVSEIDSIAGNTNFNNISLLDGSFPGPAPVDTATTNATQAAGTLTFSDLSGVETVTLNGVTFTGGSDFSTAGGTNAAVSALATALNNSTDTRLSQASYSANGSGVLTITQKAGGGSGNQYVIDTTASTSTFAVAGGATQVATTYTLTGGADNGLSAGSVTSTGSIGNALVNTQAQTPASVTFTVNTSLADGDKLQIDNGAGGTVDFTFKNTPAGATDIQIGASTQDTLRNAIAVISQYAGTDNYGTRQLNFALNGNALVITSKVSGNPTEFDGATALTIATTAGGASLSGASFNNGANTGVNTSGVTNAGFNGTFSSGFTATYVGADHVTAAITIGSQAYTANIADTTPGAPTAVRFNSTSGGYFDVQLAAGGLAVADQPGANTYASTLNAAFATLTFHQSRNVSSFSGADGLAGASARAQLADFTDPQVQDVSVTGSASGDAQISLTVNGQVFQSGSGIGNALGKYETITLTSATDSNQKITLTNGGTANDLSTANAAATFQTALRESFGLDGSNNGLNFQVGAGPGDTLLVSIGSATSGTLFGASPDISTQSGAQAAQTSIATAQGRVGKLLATVGGFQSSFNSTLANLQSTQSNVAAANSNLADTDIAATSTDYAVRSVQLNAAAAVLAQTMQLQSSLLELVRHMSA